MKSLNSPGASSGKLGGSPKHMAHISVAQSGLCSGGSRGKWPKPRSTCFAILASEDSAAEAENFSDFFRKLSRVPPSMYSIKIAKSPPGISTVPWHLITCGESVHRRIEISRRIWRRTAGSLSPCTTFKAYAVAVRLCLTSHKAAGTLIISREFVDENVRNEEAPSTEAALQSTVDRPKGDSVNGVDFPLEFHAESN
nr:hypothetical protein TorRG33x02_051120 [Ipomoea batatas]